MNSVEATSPRHLAKARRKQQGDNNSSDNDTEWRKKFEDAIRSKRTGGRWSPSTATTAAAISPVVAVSAPNNNNNTIATPVATTTTAASDMVASPNSISSKNKQQHQQMVDNMDDFILATTTYDTYDTAAEEQDPHDTSSNNNLNDVGDIATNTSADSILRRVEAEIAAARKAANHIKKNSNHTQNNTYAMIKEIQDDDDDDGPVNTMAAAQILNTDTFHSGNQNIILPPSYSSNDDDDDSSKNRAMNIIRDEFQEEVSIMENIEMVFEDNHNPNNNSSNQNISATSPPDSWLPPHSQPTSKSSLPPNNNSNSKNHSIYFTDEEWQVNNDDDNCLTAGSLVREEKKEDNMQSLLCDEFQTLSTATAHKTIPDSPSAALDTPTRKNGRRHIRDIGRRNSNTNTNEEFNPVRDPDGEYQAARTPPRLSLLQQQRLAVVVAPESEGDASLHAAGTPNRTSSTATTPTAAMTRTRELLDSLKVQRESIVRSPAAAGEALPSPGGGGSTLSPSMLANRGHAISATSPPPPPPLSTFTPTAVASSPRSPNHYFTRATKAKERVKSSSRTRSTREEQQSHHMHDGIEASLPRSGIVPATNNTSITAASMGALVSEPATPTDALNIQHDPQITQLVSVPPTSLNELSPVSKARQANSNSPIPVEATEESIKRRVDGYIDGIMEPSRRIRFRNPFPVIKPPSNQRDLKIILQDHALGLPDTPIRWLKPRKELRQLIVAAMGTSLPRRSNACGALKVLTRHAKNQMSLVRTDGFLSALIFAASQSVLDVDTDLAIDARTRAVTCLKNVCGPKENRIVIFSHPGVIECLVKVVKQDASEGRALAAAAIALLAKTPSCREGLTQIEGLIDIFAKVMKSAATLVSDEALAVRLSPSPRSKTLGDTPEFSSRRKDECDDKSNQTDSSSISSNEIDIPPTHYGTPEPIRTGTVELLKNVDSIRQQAEERHDEFVNEARCNACAALLHISKQCATSVSVVILMVHVSIAFLFSYLCPSFPV